MHKRRAAWVCAVALLACGCRQDMHDQPKYKPLEPSAFFDDNQSARPLVDGTIARGELRQDTAYYQGRTGPAPVRAIEAQQVVPPAARAAAGGEAAAFEATFAPDLVREMPIPVTAELMLRGRERFNVFCTPCHGYAGYGNGMIVQRGLTPPPSFHIARLRQAPVGHIFDVISNGYGAMYSYAQRIPVPDRWAIIAYIRALQLSQGGALSDVPEGARANIGIGPPQTPAEARPEAPR